MWRTVATADRVPNAANVGGMDKAPCELARPKAVRDAFVFPEEATDGHIERAKELCQTCPRLQACARAALYAGTSLAGDVAAPAVGVVQGGVHCDGSTAALEALEAVAGVKANHGTGKRDLVRFGEPCRACNRPMVRWNRMQVEPPEGYVTHRGRHICTECRKAYAKDLAAWRAANPAEAARRANVGRRVDRKRTSLAGLRGKVYTALRDGDTTRAEDLLCRWSVEKDRQKAQRDIAAGRAIVRLPSRGEATDRALIALQEHPSLSRRELSTLSGVSLYALRKAHCLLVRAEVPGFAGEEVQLAPDTERHYRLENARAAFAETERRSRQRAVLSLLRDRPDLSQRRVAAITGAHRKAVQTLALQVQREREKQREKELEKAAGEESSAA